MDSTFPWRCLTVMNLASDGISEFGLIDCVTKNLSTLEIACANPSRIIGANLSVALHTQVRCTRCSPITARYGKVRETLSLKPPRRRKPEIGDVCSRETEGEMADINGG